ncbi:MAG: GNAT family N-acetyltransferase [Phycisphaerales bacterium JB060]
MDAPPPWKRPDEWPLPIYTDRLELRFPRHEDAQQLFDAVDANRAAIIQWMPWPKTENLSVGQAHYTIESFVRATKNDLPANLPIFIIDRESGRYLGGTGLHDFHPDRHQAETGYWVVQDRNNEGICTEAVIGLTEAAFRPQAEGGFGLRRMEIRCAAANVGSSRVAEKAGYMLEGTLRSHYWVEGKGWSDSLIFGTTADTWKKP